MILHIPHCKFCNKVASCEYRRDLKNTLKPLAPNNTHVSHNCTIFKNHINIGDRINVKIEVAYSISEGGYGGEKIEKEILSGMATVIEKSSKGRLFVVFDDQELAKEFAERQHDNGIGFYGSLQKGSYLEDFEKLKSKGYPFWIWPANII